MASFSDGDYFDSVTALSLPLLYKLSVSNLIRQRRPRAPRDVFISYLQPPCFLFAEHPPSIDGCEIEKVWQKSRNNRLIFELHTFLAAPCVLLHVPICAFDGEKGQSALPSLDKLDLSDWHTLKCKNKALRGLTICIAVRRSFKGKGESGNPACCVRESQA